MLNDYIMLYEIAKIFYMKDSHTYKSTLWNNYYVNYWTDSLIMYILLIAIASKKISA